MAPDQPDTEGQPAAAPAALPASRRVPLVATAIVLLAIGTMIALGVWQLERLHWKEGLLERYRQSLTMSSDAPWPKDAAEAEQVLYRHATVDCAKVISLGAEAGHNQAGETGWAHVARCEIAGAGQADVVLGWSVDPKVSEWSGGTVQGFIGPGRNGEARLIVGPPLNGLQANAAPDPAEIPNNHLSYAVQWFLFALTAAIIYVLALRKKWRAR